MDRQDDADRVADSLDQQIASHHLRSATFRNTMNELQHSAKRGGGRLLTKYSYDNTIPWASKDILQSISMDAGSGLRTSMCRVGFTYFSRVLVTNVYHIVDHGTTAKQPYHVYLWNDLIGGKGPSEIISIFLHFLKTNRTGAKRLVIEVDGCSGQAFNQYFFAICGALVESTTDICRKLGAAAGRPCFERIDVLRGEVGHTFMVPDRVHGNIRRTCRKRQSVASIQEYEEIIKTCDRGRFKVTRIESGDGLFMDMKTYLEQSFKLGGAQTDIDGNTIATRSRHWANFGVGPSGGDHNRTTIHVYGAWRLRTGYDPAEIPCEIVVGRHTKPNRRAGEYTLLHPTLGEFERSQRRFVSYGHRSLCDKWREDREIKPEKLRDTHKLACLGLPEEKIPLWPCPDPETCKLERCPERARAIGVVQV